MYGNASTAASEILRASCSLSRYWPRWKGRSVKATQHRRTWLPIAVTGVLAAVVGLVVVVTTGSAPRHDAQVMAERRERIARRQGNQLFDRHIAAGEGGLREAAGLERLLDVEAAVGNARDELRVRLRLIEPAHDAEPDAHGVLLHERGNDRVQRSLARREHVGMVRLEREERAPVLQREPRAGRHETAAER